MADKLREFSTSKIPTDDIGQVVDEMINVSKDSRKSFERRWYDNNFFDDGHHFRYLSRQQNKIVDLAERSTIWAPMRAIPKASRQIRGVANLLLSQDPIPVVYPEKVNAAAFPSSQQFDPNTGQVIEVPNPEYKQALEESRRIAKLSGHFIEEEFKNQDIIQKLAQMVILTAKHGISYMQVWPDAVAEDIRSQVYDAFDVYVLGNMTELSDLPFIGKGIPMQISKIKANETFDKKQLEKINPDNRHASSEIKEAYMNARFGREIPSDHSATILLKEFFIKEYLTGQNMGRIRRQKNGEEILKNKKDGDTVIRQVYTAGDVWLKDEYVNLPDYPFVDLRLEPGPLYQVPLIERFIPANKSLDMVTSRIERYLHTMVTGIWIERQGEQYEINNTAGGQVVKYQTTPPVQGQIANLPGFVFNFLQVLQSNLEEQGVTTTTLGKVPEGVKSGVAIESLKESEFANLVIASRQLKKTIQRIAEKMLDIADNHFLHPKSYYFLERGEPQYFDVIGSSFINKRKEIDALEGVPEDVVPISKEYRVDIEIQAGLGYTQEGQKASARELSEFMVQLAQLGAIPPNVITTFLQTVLETYRFGPTAEIMDKMEEFEQQGQTTNPQIDAMKVAMAEVFKDMQQSGVLPTSEQRIEESKVATAEVAQDMGGGSNAAQER